VSSDNIVLIYGEESFLIDRELLRIEKTCGLSGPEDMNRQTFDAADTEPGTVVSSARTLPFLADKRLLVVKNAAAWKVEQWDSILAYAEKPNPSTALVLISDTVDKRRVWFKALKKSATVIECSHPADAGLSRWVNEMASDAGLRLGSRVSQSLVLRVGPDLQLLWREILKLQAYAGEDGHVTVDDVETLVGESRGASVFTFCDGLGERDLKKSMGALIKLLDLGEAPLKLLFMIARHFRILWKAWELNDGGRVNPGQAAKALGCPPFVAKRALDQARRWREPELQNALGLFMDADLQLKSGGGTEVVQRLVIELCSSR
jgi:DNA polymerase-3 subunit delta